MKKVLSIVVALIVVSVAQAQTLPPPPPFPGGGCFPMMTEQEKKALEQEASAAMTKAMIQQSSAKLALESLEAHLAQHVMVYNFVLQTYTAKKANGDYTAAEDKAIIDLATVYVANYKIENDYYKAYEGMYNIMEKDLCDLYGPLMGMNGYPAMKEALEPCAVMDKAFSDLTKSVLESDEMTVALASGPLLTLTKMVAQK